MTASRSILVLLLVMTSLGACKQKTDNQDEKTKDPNVKEEIQTKPTGLPDFGDKGLVDHPFLYYFLVDTASLTNKHCVRGAATPILNKEIYPTAEFKLMKDSITGVEVVRLNKYDILVIKNSGCDTYTLTFYFILANDKMTLQNLNHWYKKAIGLMKKISGGITAPIDVKTGVDRLMDYFKKTPYADLKYQQVMSYGNPEMPTTLSLIETRLAAGLSVLTVKVSLGPL
jgi:hypothetical protein